MIALGFKLTGPLEKELKKKTTGKLYVEAVEGEILCSVKVFIKTVGGHRIKKEEIGNAIYNWKGLGVATEGRDNYSDAVLNINFTYDHLESEDIDRKDFEEGHPCPCCASGVFEIDNSKCVCLGDSGPCHNCEEGYNFTCNNCNEELEHYLKEETEFENLTNKDHERFMNKKNSIMNASIDWGKLHAERLMKAHAYGRSAGETRVRFNNDWCTKPIDPVKVLGADVNIYGDRGSGRTHKQIEALPFGSVFVSCHSVLDVTTKLYRTDIVLITRKTLDDDTVEKLLAQHRLSGQSRPVYFDHYSYEQLTGLSKERIMEHNVSREQDSIIFRPRSDWHGFTEPLVKEFTEKVDNQIIKPTIRFTKTTPVTHRGNEKDELTLDKPKMEETNMNRRNVKVSLVDNSPSIPDSKALVFTKTIFTSLDREDIIRQVLLEGDVVEALHNHNKVRENTVDEEILKRVGNEVKLRKVELKDLEWQTTSV